MGGLCFLVFLKAVFAGNGKPSCPFQHQASDAIGIRADCIVRHSDAAMTGLLGLRDSIIADFTGNIVVNRKQEDFQYLRAKHV